MMKKGLALLLTLCLLLIPGCSSKKENVIKIVDGRVTEQKLVHRMIKMLVEDRTDLTVSIGEEMTAVNAYNEMKKRVYDVYMSYDGTVLTTFLHRDPSEGRHLTDSRSEERRVGKECRCRRSSERNSIQVQFKNHDRSGCRRSGVGLQRRT